MSMAFLTARIYTWAALLTLALTGVTGGLSVCQGHDGHVTIEPVAYRHCATSDDLREHVGEREFHGSAARAATCCDADLAFAMAGNSRLSIPARSRLGQGDIDQSPSPSSDPLMRLEHRGHAIASVHHSSSHLSHLRTIVLLRCSSFL